MNKINAFTNGKLSEEETDALLHELLSKKFDKVQQAAWVQQLQAQHGVSRSAPAPSLSGSALGWKVWMRAAAAAIVLILAATIGFYLTQQAPEYQQLADNLIFQEKLAYGDFRKGANDGSALRLKAADAYQNGDYPNALLHWQLLKSQTAFNADDQFFLALTHLYLKDYPSAAAAFGAHQGMVPKGGRFEQESAYFYALTLIKTGQLEESKAKLLDLQAKTESQFIKSRVARLLEAIK